MLIKAIPLSLAKYDINNNGIIDVAEGVRVVAVLPLTGSNGEQVMVLADGRLYIFTP